MRNLVYWLLKIFSFSTFVQTVFHKKTDSILLENICKTMFLNWNYFGNTRKNLTHFMPLISFYTLWKHQKTICLFDVFRGYWNSGISENLWLKEKKMMPDFSCHFVMKNVNQKILWISDDFKAKWILTHFWSMLQFYNPFTPPIPCIVDFRKLHVNKN